MGGGGGGCGGGDRELFGVCLVLSLEEKRL